MFDAAPYVGIPYADKGRDVSAGLDCWGLVRHVYLQEFGIDLPALDGRYSGSVARAEIDQLVREETAANWEQINTPDPGDIVVMTLSDRPFHVGVVLAGHRVLHNLSPKQGAITESLRGSRWANRIEGYYRHASRC